MQVSHQKMRFLYRNGLILETRHICMDSLIMSLHGNVNNSKFIKNKNSHEFRLAPPPPRPNTTDGLARIEHHNFTLSLGRLSGERETYITIFFSRSGGLPQHGDLDIETEEVLPGDIHWHARAGRRRHEVSIWRQQGNRMARWVAMRHHSYYMNIYMSRVIPSFYLGRPFFSWTVASPYEWLHNMQLDVTDSACMFRNKLFPWIHVEVNEPCAKLFMNAKNECNLRVCFYLELTFHRRLLVRCSMSGWYKNGCRRLVCLVDTWHTKPVIFILLA